nr:hypothetical protein [Tanacetum cinerariifolium]
MTISEYLEYEEIRKAQGREKQLPFSNKSESELYDEQQTLLTTVPLVYAYATSLSTERAPDHNTQNDDEEDISEWFEAELEKCWKIQQGKDHNDYRKQTQINSLRNWEAQIDSENLTLKLTNAR